MELYYGESAFEKHLIQKANALKLPYGGGMELLPLCNMNCNMCYVRNNEKGIWEQLLRAEDWIGIGKKARDAGVLFVLLTGGEPLLHPDFKEIYLAFREMGFILTVNTNGTLLNEEWADFFKENPCRRLNITLYGACNETYTKLCHNPRGFDQVMNALQLLKERNVMCRINLTLTRENRQDLKEMTEIARNLEMPFVPATYMFPTVQNGFVSEKFQESRMSPYEAAETRLESTFLRNPDVDKTEQARRLMENIIGPVAVVSSNTGFSCTAGRSGYWVNWQGHLSPCAMIPDPWADITKCSFETGWKEIVEKVEKIETCKECKTCRKKFFCQSCAAASFTEKGNFRERPQYLCDVTDAMIQVLLSYLPLEEQKKYECILKEIMQ